MRSTWSRLWRLPAIGVGIGMLSVYGSLPDAGAQATRAAGLFRIRDERILESSSLVVSTVDPGLAYTANDSGDGANIYTIDMSSGATVGVTTLSGVEPTDVEAMAPGPGGLLFVGDIGDNRGVRDNITVYWIAQPAAVNAAVGCESATLVYPDGPRDAEALLVDPASGRLFVVSKELFGGTIYAAPNPLSQGGDNRLRPVGSAPGLVTDGTFLPSGRVVLRTYTTAVSYDPARWSPLSSTALPRQPQGESIAALPGAADVLVGSEGPNSQVYRVRLDRNGAVTGDQPTRIPVRPSEQPPASHPPTGATPRAQPFSPPVAVVPDRSQLDQSLIAPVALLAGLLGAAVTVVLVRRRSGGR